MKKKVLVITYSGDNICVNRVVEALQKKGAEVIRFNSDHYPVFIQVNASIDNNGKERKTIISPEYELDLIDVSAIWYRRLRLGANLKDYMEAPYINATLEESNNTLRGTLDSMDIFQLDYYLKHRIAANKFQQLKLAQQLGMNIPDTLMGNNLDQVKDFYNNHNENVIVKMQSSFAIYDQEGNESVVFTNKVDKSLLEDADALQLCPMKFQSNLEKKRELRITVVSNLLFVAAIDSQKLESAKIDWRKEGHALIDDWYKFEISKELEAKILAFMDLYQLNYGAFDFIETHDGKLHFLEVNSGGEFCWLDNLFEGEICDALASTLLGELPQRTDRFPRF